MNDLSLTGVPSQWSPFLQPWALQGYYDQPEMFDLFINIYYSPCPCRDFFCPISITWFYISYTTFRLDVISHSSLQKAGIKVFMRKSLSACRFYASGAKNNFSIITCKIQHFIYIVLMMPLKVPTILETKLI